MKFAIYGNKDETSAFEPRTARAYCDGRKAAFNGDAIGTNPFPSNRERENNLAWTAGFNDYTGVGSPPTGAIPASETHCAI